MPVIVKQRPSVGEVSDSGHGEVGDVLLQLGEDAIQNICRVVSGLDGRRESAKYASVNRIVEGSQCTRKSEKLVASTVNAGQISVCFRGPVCLRIALFYSNTRGVRRGPQSITVIASLRTVI